MDSFDGTQEGGRKEGSQIYFFEGKYLEPVFVDLSLIPFCSWLPKGEQPPLPLSPTVIIFCLATDLKAMEYCEHLQNTFWSYSLTYHPLLYFSTSINPLPLNKSCLHYNYSFSHLLFGFHLFCFDLKPTKFNKNYTFVHWSASYSTMATPMETMTPPPPCQLLTVPQRLERIASPMNPFLPLTEQKTIFSQ